MNPTSMPMVQYWKYRVGNLASVRKQKDGSVAMFLEGEAQPLAGVPRSHILFGPISKMKHEIKNQIFNESWAMLENQNTPGQIAYRAKNLIPELYKYYEAMRYDVVPPETMLPPVREIYRAWTKAAPSAKSYMLRDMLCFVLQEDDGYRNRVQWIATHFSWLLKRTNPVKCLDRAFAFLEHAEVIDDMKERQRLLRRVTMALLEDEGMHKAFLAFWKEIDWNKVKLTEADKYHFRGKYFKVDLDKFEY